MKNICLKLHHTKVCVCARVSKIIWSTGNCIVQSQAVFFFPFLLIAEVNTGDVSFPRFLKAQKSTFYWIDMWAIFPPIRYCCGCDIETDYRRVGGLYLMCHPYFKQSNSAVDGTPGRATELRQVSQQICACIANTLLLARKQTWVNQLRLSVEPIIRRSLRLTSHNRAFNSVVIYIYSSKIFDSVHAPGLAPFAFCLLI